jgi:hypothetical protein
VDIKIGDIIELVPDLSPPVYWWEGQGLVVSVDQHVVDIQMFFLNRIDKRNFSELYRENVLWTITLETAKSGFLKYIG